MRRGFLFLLGAVILRVVPATICVPGTWAQSTGDSSWPKFEVYGAYARLDSSYHTFDFAKPDFSITDDMSGNSGLELGATRNFHRWLGIAGEFSAHFSHDNLPATFKCGAGAPPSCNTITQTASIDPELFNFLVGPEFKARNRSRFTPFANALFGVSHLTNTFSTASASLTFSRSETETGFAMAFGGGVEVRIHGPIGFRYSADYDLAYLGQNTAGTRQRLDSVRSTFGIAIRIH
jgi:opacity protein-like surface antigen